MGEVVQIFTDPREWQAAQEDLIEDGNCGCRMTLRQCRIRQRSRKNFEVADDDQSAIAREFLICAGDKKGKRKKCRYFQKKTSPIILRSRFTKEGIERNKKAQVAKKSSEEKRNPGQLAVINQNPDAFAWMLRGYARSWRL